MLFWEGGWMGSSTTMSVRFVLMFSRFSFFLSFLFSVDAVTGGK